MTADRDASIERLLRRARASDPGVPDDCPDAETLAAFADDTLTATLSAPARREIESHVADCHRCQELTVAMARAGVGAAAHAGSPLADAVEKAAPWWAGRRLRWLVPAAAAATAVALWVAIPDQRTTVSQAPVSDVRESQPQGAAPELQDQVSAAPERAADAAAQEAAQAAAPAAPSPPPPAPSAPPAAEFGVAGQAADRQNDLARSEAAAGEQDAARGQQARSAPAPAAVGSVAGLRAAAPLEILSPDPRIRWRIGPGRLVQHSTDAGATWTTQEAGAQADLTAGSSPAPEVCWLVGRGGLVLRTINGGRDWQRTAMPAAIDLVGITASSAVNATVSLTDGRRFATTDGGRTWMAVR